MDEIKIYRLTNEISFRQCSLSSGKATNHGNCTDFYEREENWKPFYYCNQNGIHFHCTKHPAIELNKSNDFRAIVLSCPKCKNEIRIDDFEDLIRKSLRVLNTEKFKDAKLIRLDDWYIPEVKERIKTPSEYWVESDIKTDKDGDTIVVLYVGHTGSSEKAQFFIKPEKLQLSTDHKDMDPAKVLSKIEITLKDRTLKQSYDN